MSTQRFPDTHCPCGAGVCKVKQAKKGGRDYYMCPGQYERHCPYFMWCDKLKPDEILHSHPIPYPLCPCKAGVYRLETDEDGRKYFACHILKGFGACNFRLWQDDYLQSILVYCETENVGDNHNSISDEIDDIKQAIEKGLIEPDFYAWPYEESPLEMETDASNEVVSADDDLSSSTSRHVYLSDIPQNEFVHGSKSDSSMEDSSLEANSTSSEVLTLADYNDEDWWSQVINSSSY